MNYYTKLIFIRAFLFLAPIHFNYTVNCQNSDIFNSESVVIARWKNFKHAAYSVSFDDGTNVQFYEALPILDSLNIKSTLYVTTAHRDSATWHYLNEEAKKGHEIGSHTVTHKVLPDATKEELKFELIESKKSIIQNVPAQTGSFTFCYPGGPTNSTIIEEVEKYYIAARTVSFGFNTDTTNMYKLCNAWTQPPVRNAYKELKSHLISLKNDPKSVWLIHTFHGFEGKHFEPIPLSVFRRVMIETAKDSNLIWIAPVRDVVRYMLERKHAVISIETITNSRVTFNIGHSLSDSSFNYPLSIKVLLPYEWSNLIVKQGDKYIPFRMENILNNKFIFFDIKPDKETISIENTNPSDANSYNFSIRNFPVPFSENLSLEIISPQKGKVSISILNTNGGIEYLGTSFLNNGLNTINLNTQSLSDGIKIIHVVFEESKLIYTGKIMKSKY